MATHKCQGEYFSYFGTVVSPVRMEGQTTSRNFRIIISALSWDSEVPIRDKTERGAVFRSQCSTRAPVHDIGSNRGRQRKCKKTEKVVN